MPKDGAIGIFDSGVGGLTVLQCLAESLPREDLPDRFIKVGARFLGNKVESAVRIERP